MRNQNAAANRQTAPTMAQRPVLLSRMWSGGEYTYCTPKKQVQLLKAFVSFYRRGRAVIGRGAPFARIRELPVVLELQRAKSEIRSDDEEGLKALLGKVDEQLGALEGEYE